MSLSLFFDLLYILILMLFICVGVYRGFIKSFVRSARFILSVVAAYAFGGAVGELLNSAFVGGWIYQGVWGTVDGMIGDSVSGMTAETLLSSFPSFLIGDSGRAAVENAFADYTGEALVSRVAAGIASPISSLVCGILGYLLVFIVAMLVLKLFAWLLTEWADRISLLGAVNRILGGAWGALSAALLLLAISAVIKLFFKDSEVYTDSRVVRLFADSFFLDFLKN